MMKTLAAILVRQKAPLKLAEVTVPSPRRGQVLVRVLATGICGSQLDEIDGKKGTDPWLPHLLGHEACGIVERCGPGVRQVKAGDKVVLHWRPGRGLEGAPASYRLDGRTVHAGRVTTFQERTVVSENRLTRVPSGLDPALAALYGCCLLTGFGVVERDAALRAGESVVVFGAGGVGLAEIIAARLAKASKIVVIDPFPKKLALAKRLGATHGLIGGKSEAIESRVLRLVGASGADVVLENTGKSAVIGSAYRVAAAQGRVILVGVPSPKDPAVIDTLPLHFGKKLTGSHGGGALPWIDIPRILALQKKRSFDPQLLLSRSYFLKDINRAIEDMRKGLVGRPIIRMHGSGPRT